MVAQASSGEISKRAKICSEVKSSENQVLACLHEVIMSHPYIKLTYILVTQAGTIPNLYYIPIVHATVGSTLTCLVSIPLHAKSSGSSAGNTCMVSKVHPSDPLPGIFDLIKIPNNKAYYVIIVYA